MDRLPVTSSNVADIGYDAIAMTLEVGFHNGSVYQYFDVPENVHREFLNSDSKGKFLNSNIKNNFRYARL